MQEVELLGFEEKKKQKWELTTSERLDLANAWKAEGTELFQKKEFAKAAKKYEEAADYAVGEGITGNNIPVDERPLFVSCWSNAAMCRIKTNEFTEAIEACNHVLELDDEAKNIKVLYRRGFSHL